MALLATFWTGSIDALERACLASFSRQGHEVILYSYEERAPSQHYKVRPASEILDHSYINRFIYDGRPNIAAFSDAFRVKMFTKSAAIWIDCDLLLTGALSVDGSQNIFVREGKHNIIAALLRIADHSIAEQALHKILAQVDKDLPWAALQNIIPKAIAKANCDIGFKEPDVYNPMPADHFYKLILPEFREECENACRRAETVHIYNNILQKIGFYKDLLPPQGSFLHDLLYPFAAEAGFVGTYPAPVVRAMVEGWHLRFSGRDLGIGAVLRQMGPALRTTTRRRLWV